MTTINSLINLGKNGRQQLTKILENYAEKGLITEKTLQSIKTGKKCTDEMIAELNRATFFEKMSPEEIKAYYTTKIAQASMKDLIKKIAKDAYKPL